jgi:hypothetical protein
MIFERILLIWVVNQRPKSSRTRFPELQFSFTADFVSFTVRRFWGNRMLFNLNPKTEPKISGQQTTSEFK